MRILLGLHKPTVHLNHMRIFVGLHKSIVSPPQSYEDTCRTTKVYCLDITYKTLQHHHLNHMGIFVGLHKSTIHLNHMRIFVGLRKSTVHLNHMRIFVGIHKSTVLILLTRLSLTLLTIFTASPPQSYEDICRTTQVYCITT